MNQRIASAGSAAKQRNVEQTVQQVKAEEEARKDDAEGTVQFELVVPERATVARQEIAEKALEHEVEAGAPMDGPPGVRRRSGC